MNFVEEIEGYGLVVSLIEIVCFICWISVKKSIALADSIGPIGAFDRRCYEC